MTDSWVFGYRSLIRQSDFPRSSRRRLRCWYGGAGAGPLKQEGRASVLGGPSEPGIALAAVGEVPPHRRLRFSGGAGADRGNDLAMLRLNSRQVVARIRHGDAHALTRYDEPAQELQEAGEMRVPGRRR